MTPPEGATGVGVLTNGNMKTAQAVSPESGVTPPSTWGGKRVRAAVAGLLPLGQPQGHHPAWCMRRPGERMDVVRAAA